MTHALRLVACLALVALSVGCLTTTFDDIQIRTKADPKVNFEGYDTYAWYAAAAAVHDPEGEWTEPGYDVAAEIIFVTNRELRERGMIEVAESPDVLAMYAVGVDMQALNLRMDASGTKNFEEIPKGAVAIILADPQTRQILWVGTAEAELNAEITTELAMERLDWAIRTMFKEAPF